MTPIACPPPQACTSAVVVTISWNRCRTELAGIRKLRANDSAKRSLAGLRPKIRRFIQRLMRRAA